MGFIGKSLSVLSEARKVVIPTAKERFEETCRTIELYDGSNKLIKTLQGRFSEKNLISFSEKFTIDGSHRLKTLDNFIYKFVPNTAKEHNVFIYKEAKTAFSAFSVAVEEVTDEEKSKLLNIYNIQLANGNNIIQSNSVNINVTICDIINEVTNINNPNLSPICEELKQIENGEKQIKKGMFKKFAPFFSDTLSSLLGGFLSGLLLK